MAMPAESVGNSQHDPHLHLVGDNGAALQPERVGPGVAVKDRDPLAPVEPISYHDLGTLDLLQLHADIAGPDYTNDANPSLLARQIVNELAERDIEPFVSIRRDRAALAEELAKARIDEIYRHKALDAEIRERVAQREQAEAIASAHTTVVEVIEKPKATVSVASVAAVPVIAPIVEPVPVAPEADPLIQRVMARFEQVKHDVELLRQERAAMAATALEVTVEPTTGEVIIDAQDYDRHVLAAAELEAKITTEAPSRRLLERIAPGVVSAVKDMLRVAAAGVFALNPIAPVNLAVAHANVVPSVHGSALHLGNVGNAPGLNLHFAPAPATNLNVALAPTVTPNANSAPAPVSHAAPASAAANGNGTPPPVVNSGGSGGGSGGGSSSGGGGTGGNPTPPPGNPTPPGNPNPPGNPPPPGPGPGGGGVKPPSKLKDDPSTPECQAGQNPAVDHCKDPGDKVGEA